MPDDSSLANVYAYVEQAYLHKQVGDVLASCLDKTSLNPLYEWVQMLFLAGPQSLRVMNQILEETLSRKRQVRDDLSQVWNGFLHNLDGLGVSLDNHFVPQRIIGMRVNGFRSVLREQLVSDLEVEKTCLRLFRDTRDLVRRLLKHINLLSEIEDYLKDWMMGLMYSSTRQSPEGKTSSLNYLM